MNPKVSVIIPIYNVEDFFERCIDSFKKQTYKNLEIILVDDGSTDNSGKLCDKQKSETIKVIHQENKGLPAARNIGVSNATGDYIFFCDSDDWIDIDLIEKLVKNKKNNSLSGCNIKDIFKKRINLHNRIGKIEKEKFIKEIVSGKKEAFVVGYLFDIKVCKNIEFDESIRYFEDISYLIEYLKNTKENEISFEENSFYNYYQNQDSITLSQKNTYDKVHDLFKTTSDVNNKTNNRYKTELISRELIILEALLQHANNSELKQILKDFKLPTYSGKSKIIKKFIKLYNKEDVTSIVKYYKIRKIAKTIIMKTKNIGQHRI